MRVVNGLLSALVAAGGLASQVHYHEDGRPWSQRAASGPDKVCLLYTSDAADEV